MGQGTNLGAKPTGSQSISEVDEDGWNWGEESWEESEEIGELRSGPSRLLLMEREQERKRRTGEGCEQGTFGVPVWLPSSTSSSTNQPPHLL